MRTRIERVKPDADLARAIGLWKRLRRHGWNLAVIQERATGDLIAFGFYDPGQAPEPDHSGQYEIDTSGL